MPERGKDLMAHLRQLSSVKENKYSISPLLAQGSIKLDFSSDVRRNLPKRSSFLPASWMDSEGGSDKSVTVTPTPTLATFDARKSVKSYCTGSKYVGQFNRLGFCGKGIYKFPHNVIYDGYFNKKGEFHGTGVLIYPGGQRVEGFWKNGKMVQEANYISHDQSTFGSQYCKMPDRRFQIEVENEILPAGQEYHTNSPFPRHIPEGMYDTGDGFYDPQNKVIIDARDVSRQRGLSDLTDSEQCFIQRMIEEGTPSQAQLQDKMRESRVEREQAIARLPTREVEEWIVANCRKAWDEPMGYRAELYEVWTPGYKRDEYSKRLSRVSTMIDEERLLRQLQEEHRDSKQAGLYSFIRNAFQLKQKRVPDSEKGSVTELCDMFIPLGVSQTKISSKKQIFHHQKWAKKGRSGHASEAHTPRRGSYSPKYLMHYRNQLKKRVIRDDLNLIKEKLMFINK